MLEHTEDSERLSRAPTRRTLTSRDAFGKQRWGPPPPRRSSSKQWRVINTYENAQARGADHSARERTVNRAPPESFEGARAQARTLTRHVQRSTSHKPQAVCALYDRTSTRRGGGGDQRLRPERLQTRDIDPIGRGSQCAYVHVQQGEAPKAAQSTRPTSSGSCGASLLTTSRNPSSRTRAWRKRCAHHRPRGQRSQGRLLPPVRYGRVVRRTRAQRCGTGSRWAGDARASSGSVRPVVAVNSP